MSNIGYQSFIIKEIEISPVKYIGDVVEEIIKEKQIPKLTKERGLSLYKEGIN